MKTKKPDKRARFGWTSTLDDEPQRITEHRHDGVAFPVAVIPMPFSSPEMRARVRDFAKSLWPVALLLLCLTSCGPFIDTQRGIVSTGFLSQTQGFSGSMKTQYGSVTWSVVGHDSTSVANNALMAYGVVKAADSAYKTVVNNNATATTQAANAQASTLALQQDAEKAAAAGTAAKNLNAAQTTARANGVPALVKP